MNSDNIIPLNNITLVDSWNQTFDEFEKKCDILISEYNSLKERNEELREVLEKYQKIKMILMNPSLFDVEMRKAQLEIQTYIDSLNDIERLSSITLDKINQIHEN